MKRIINIFPYLRTQSGFTVVELIIVIVIVGILALSVSAKYMDLSASADRATCIANQSAMKYAQTLYYADQITTNGVGQYAVVITDLVPFLHRGITPVCPGEGSYVLHAGGDISCTEGSHAQ